MLPQSIWRSIVKLFRHAHNQLLVASLTAFNEPRIYLSRALARRSSGIANCRSAVSHHLSARLFGRDPRVDGDNEATRHVRIEVILIVWLGLTTLLVVEWVGLWIN